MIDRRILGSFLGFIFACVSTGLLAAGFDSEYEEKKWEEIEARLPPFPKPENLDSFFVSATTDNKFMVDRESISVGADGVVRYTLVVLSSSGAQNISYDGLRCATGERRLYAFGRSDKTWSKARLNQWTKIQESTLNRHHAALFFDFFAPTQAWYSTLKRPGWLYVPAGTHRGLVADSSRH